jgi:D-alanyl-D-alanine endopeptidase (penicillin-binding protein 7)
MTMTLDTVMLAVGWALVRFVWQGALLGCICAVLLVATRNRSPQLRYLIACASLGACVALPLFDMWQACHARPDFTLAANEGVGAEMSDIEVEQGLFDLVGGNMKSLVSIWSVCAAVLALRLGVGLFWISKTFGAGRQDARLQAALDRLAARMGVVKAVRLRVADGLFSPVAAGILRSTVVVPSALVGGMPPDLLDALLAHELAHIRRHDYLVNLLQTVVETLLFYHPAVWWISRHIRVEREMIADELAAQAIGEPRRLALALSELEKFQLTQYNLAQAANGGVLMQRIKKLVSPEAQAINWKAAIPVLGLIFASMAFYADAAATASSASATDGKVTPSFSDLAACKPEYPIDARNGEQQGTVKVQISVNSRGKFTGTKVLSSSGYPALDNATTGAFSRCKFKPAYKNGKPVASSFEAVYVWKLED